jgi:cryptochrome
MTQQQTTQTTHAIIWFRKNLRLHDNPALIEACTKDVTHLFPIYILDENHKMGINRLNFLYESLADLDNNIRFLSKGKNRLIVLKGKTQKVLPRVIKEWKINKLCYEIDHHDPSIHLIKNNNTNPVIVALGGHILYDQFPHPPPKSMQSFIKLVDKMGEPPLPLPSPSWLPPLPSLFSHFNKTKILRKDNPIFKGGESEALKRLEDIFKTSKKGPKWIASFNKPLTDPTAFIMPSTTALSPYISLGCLSCRLFYHRIMEAYKKQKNNKTTKPPISLQGQLLWREFFYTVGTQTPNFTKMVGNPICRQIQWKNDNNSMFKAWREGHTGYPWIDALMRQLIQWGWMHHLGRHCVACFLTRGDLFIHWEHGQEVFEELLIDHDTYLNAGNWLWLSASSFFHQYYKVYNPITFGKKYDKSGAFIRHFVPELRTFPDKYIYEPWNAPLDVQEKSNCIIGKDYPIPIVDHNKVYKENIARLKIEYKKSI